MSAVITANPAAFFSLDVCETLKGPHLVALTRTAISMLYNCRIGN